ncbi:MULTISPECIES: hypothetical protein [Streptacidiphilus]|uniref:Secreted protein n=1 Tax=Streptacidiphilus cavernicola TaxID=3342716 RepID=A0ABV6UST7_9ACTN|nr:hypothetical protein [Streptacidiphilus jeojiense]
MPRGRHRQSSPLSRLLPPTACGVLAIAALISAVFVTDPGTLRVLVVAASVGAFAGAVLLRLREHAGEVELEAEVAARSRDEARFEDRVAELEYAAEAAEEQVKRLERRLLAQRSQIARAEAENARLLRERARIAAEQALREAEEAQRKEVALRGMRPTATAYLKAAAALRGLERRAAVGQAQRIAAGAAGAGGGVVVEPVAEPVVEQVAAEPEPKQERVRERAQERSAFRPKAPKAAKVKKAAAAVAEAPAGPAWARAALPPLRPASPVLPRQSRDVLRQDAGSSGTFNFFSRQETAISTELGDLADVVGTEAAAAQREYADAGVADGAAGTAEDVVHDLTAEDETEPIDVRSLRAL